MKNILNTPFVEEMRKATANMYRLGWDERNGGNIIYLLDETEVGQYRKDFLNLQKRMMSFMPHVEIFHMGHLSNALITAFCYSCLIKRNHSQELGKRFAGVLGGRRFA